MKKVTVFVGSAHKRMTQRAVVKFQNALQALGDVEVEIVTLSDYKLGICRGCRVCFDRGEELCPLKDDRDVLFEKIAASDGVVFATPNYTYQMSGMMKAFLDRFGFICHRPRFFGKVSTSIVTQGFMRGNEIVSYFDFAMQTMGFSAVKGACLTALDPPSEKEQQKIDKSIAELSKRFHAKLMQPAFNEPSWLMLMGFRMGRNAVLKASDRKSRDYVYYTEKGWLESDYFYPTRLSPLKKAGGKLFDKMAPTIQKMMAVISF